MLHINCNYNALMVVCIKVGVLCCVTCVAHLLAFKDFKTKSFANYFKKYKNFKIFAAQINVP